MIKLLHNTHECPYGTMHVAMPAVFMIALLFSVASFGAGSTFAQGSTIRGKVTDPLGAPLPGVSIILRGTNNGTNTDAEGFYTLSVAAPENAWLIFSFIGYTTQTRAIGNNTILDVRLAEEASALDEIVVVGYTTQKKKDVVGAVSIIKPNDLLSTPASDLTTQLQGRAAGVNVSSTGNPGGTATVRIRGFSSYGNNNPLYIIDGVPTTDPSRINPQDIESLQVLKDASSASIYGARAANGVIIATTKQGKPGKTTVSYDSYVGVQSLPYGRVPKLLNTNETVEYLRRTTNDNYIDPLFGAKANFTVPAMYVVSNDFTGGVAAGDPRANPSLYTIRDYKNIYQIFETSPGTDWFKAMSQRALVQSHQIHASGGTESSVFSVGLNYFDQQGTFKYTGYDRYSIRINSSFSASRYLRIGENLQVSHDNRQGDNTVIGESSAWGNAYRSAPYIPVYDIEGGFGGTRIGSTSGVGFNPVANLYRRKDWAQRSLRIFGNVFADLTLTDWLTARTAIGIDAGSGTSKMAALREYERSEARSVTSLTEGSGNFASWTWTNTVNLRKTFHEHDVKVLLGTEAIHNESRGMSVVVNNFDAEADEFLSLNTAQPKSLGDVTVSNPTIATTSLFSYFGRVDYGYKEKYLINATFRRDGSSLFGPGVRYANFPSVGVAWRLSDEAFLKNFTLLDELKVRGGWGMVGSISNVPAFNQFSTFMSQPGSNNYDIAGGTKGSAQGFGQASQGNSNTKWESTETANIGIDVSLQGGAWTLALDVYTKNTRDMLVPGLRNGMEPIITKPLINLGTMNNKGIDLQITHQGIVGGDLHYDASLSFSHYKNKLTRLNNENTSLYLPANRLPNVLITTKGQAVSSFNGYVIDGFYNDASEVANGPRIGGAPATVGTWRYRDMNNDGNINANDQTILGSPHPDFQMGLNLALRWKNFDFNTFFFWNYGNEIFNYTKFYTYMNVLGGGIAQSKLYDAWTPETASHAKTPALGTGSENGYTSFVTGNPSSFYVENGSYLRARTVQLGYTVPSKMGARAGFSKLRFYVQAQNLFTLTHYTGADPDLGLVSGASNDQSVRTDQNLGVDYSGFPNPRQFLAGINLSF